MPRRHRLIAGFLPQLLPPVAKSPLFGQKRRKSPGSPNQSRRFFPLEDKLGFHHVHTMLRLSRKRFQAHPGHISQDSCRSVSQTRIAVRKTQGRVVTELVTRDPRVLKNPFSRRSLRAPFNCHSTPTCQDSQPYRPDVPSICPFHDSKPIVPDFCRRVRTV